VARLLAFDAAFTRDEGFPTWFGVSKIGARLPLEVRTVIEMANLCWRTLRRINRKDCNRHVSANEIDSSRQKLFCRLR